MGLESLKNESLCLEIQAGGKNVDLCLAQLLRNNAEEFAQWAKEAVAEALKKEAAMSPDELMGEAMRGFRRAAETYKPETHTDFITGAEFWVKQCGAQGVAGENAGFRGRVSADHGQAAA